MISYTKELCSNDIVLRAYVVLAGGLFSVASNLCKLITLVSRTKSTTILHITPLHKIEYYVCMY